MSAIGDLLGDEALLMFRGTEVSARIRHEKTSWRAA
jgi:hypothetical protein